MNKLTKEELLVWLKIFDKDCHNAKCIHAKGRITTRINAVLQIRKLIEQSEPEMDEKWIEEKTEKLHAYLIHEPFGFYQLRDFIRSLVAEIGQKRPSVDMGSWFYKNCRSQRRRGAKICQSCPFRGTIEAQETGMEVKDK